MEFYTDESGPNETKIKKILTHPQETEVINILKEYAQSDRRLLLILNKPRIDVDDSDPKCKRIKFQVFGFVSMKKILTMPIVMLGIILAIPVFQSAFGSGLSPIEAVIMINENQNKSVFFQPNITAVRVSGEILIANNSTSGHSVTSGSGPDDPMSGKFFNTNVIKPKGFVEYIPENLKPGNYSFYSSTDPQIRGQLVVVPNK